MTLREFENGYWYLADLKAFAIQIGIPEARRLRKDELERAIISFLRTGTLSLPTKRALRKKGAKDLERGLSLNLRIEHYTSNRETKDFIIREAGRLAPEVREKSGVWYRLNRWREEQITNGRRPTYGDLVRQYVAWELLNGYTDLKPGKVALRVVREFAPLVERVADSRAEDWRIIPALESAAVEKWAEITSIASGRPPSCCTTCPTARLWATTRSRLPSSLMSATSM